MRKCYIKKVAFRNCQSLKDVSYDLVDGINIITAPNSTGKSVFYKALKVAVGTTYFSNKELLHLISYGESSAMALFTFSDNSVGGFLATIPNPSSKQVTLQYCYREPHTTQFDISTFPNPIFLQKMSVVIDNKTNFIMNVLDPDQELLFVNSKETTNSTIVELISDNPVLERLLPMIESNLEQTQSALGKAKHCNQLATTTLDSLDKADINLLQTKIDYGDAFIIIGKNLLSVHEYINSLSTFRYIDFDTVEHNIEMLKSLEEILGQVNSLYKINNIDYDKYTSICNNLDNSIQLFDAVNTLHSVPNVDYSKYFSLCNLLDNYSEMLSFVCKINYVTDIKYDTYIELNNHLDLFSQTKTLVDTLQFTEKILNLDLDNYLDLDKVYSLFSKTLNEINELHLNSKRLIVLEEDLKDIYGKMDSLCNSVMCPVKGKVFYSESGCVKDDR